MALSSIILIRTILVSNYKMNNFQARIHELSYSSSVQNYSWRVLSSLLRISGFILKMIHDMFCLLFSE